MMKHVKIGSKGNILIGTMAILIVSFIILAIFIISSLYLADSENIESISNDNFKYIIEDYDKNIESKLHESIEDTSQKVVMSRFPIQDSEDTIKKELNKKLDSQNREFNEKYGITIESDVLSVETTDSPFIIKTNVQINAEKDGEKFSSILTGKASIEGLKDPLPFTKCGFSLTFFYIGDRIQYGTSLTEYLALHGAVDAGQGYIGASSPLTIKKCPFDPYTHHGDGLTLKKCLDDGYFHESADGSCYLCRLEGKGTCPHYGLEVFIVTLPNPEIQMSTSAPDHVIFKDSYPGLAYEVWPTQRLFLDSSHRQKYGLI